MNEIVSLGDIINSPEYEKRELEEALEIVKKYLREDVELFQKWENDLFRAYYDEYMKEWTEKNQWNPGPLITVHMPTCAKQAAFNFLNTLIKE